MEAVLQFFRDLADVSFIDYAQLFLKTIYLLLIGFGVFLLLNRLLAKVLFRNDTQQDGRLNRDDTLKVTLLWTIIGLFLLFNVFWALILYANGLPKLETNPWYSLLPVIVVYLSLAGLFLYQFFTFRKSLN
ncbi:MAG: hypothetical protein AAF587_14380 [Bacteroidota bacterium]